MECLEVCPTGVISNEFVGAVAVAFPNMGGWARELRQGPTAAGPLWQGLGPDRRAGPQLAPLPDAVYNGAPERRPALKPDFQALRRFEEEFSREHRLSPRQALALLDGLWEEGCALGVLPPEEPLAGIEVDIRVARILNSCSKSSSPA